MSLGIYIHWPFCKSKCPYCDFNSHVAERIDHRRWRDAYLKSLAYWFEKTKDRTVETVFFGGGTPSLMEPQIVADILSFVKDHWQVAPDLEVTLEANPTSFEIPKFEAFRTGGVNRVSIGVQSLRDADLKFLGREHNPEQAKEAIRAASQIFDRYSFDLICARPNQSIDDWRTELNEALEMAGGHLSLYQLTIEQGTPFYTRYVRGEFQVPEQDTAADFYDVTQEIMAAAGLPAYEVSNHARTGEESRHNLIYWRYGDYIGIGPGAHGRVTLDGEKFATRDHRASDIWLSRVEEMGAGSDPFERVDPYAQFQECLMMGLRLREGVPFARLVQVLGGYVFEVIDRDRFDVLVREGMIEDNKETLRTTKQGFKCLNAVLGYLLRGSHGSAAHTAPHHG